MSSRSRAEQCSVASFGRYEVQGEFVIPSSANIPRSAADVALRQGAAGALSPFETDTGRWRLQVPSFACWPALHHMHMSYACRASQACSTC